MATLQMNQTERQADRRGMNKTARQTDRQIQTPNTHTQTQAHAAS